MSSNFSGISTVCIVERLERMSEKRLYGGLQSYPWLLRELSREESPKVAMERDSVVRKRGEVRTLIIKISHATRPGC